MDKNIIKKIYWGAIGFEFIALFGLLSPAVHGFADLLDIDILQGKSISEIPSTILFMYRINNFFVEPGLVFSIFLGAIGFSALGNFLKNSKIKDVPTVKWVIWALVAEALTRIPKIASGLNFLGELENFATYQNIRLLQFASMLKGISAILTALAAIFVSVVLIKLFNHNAVRLNQNSPGKTGAKMILWSVIAAVPIKTLAIYYYPELLSAAFIISQMVKSMGLSFISVHLFLFAYNHEPEIFKMSKK